MTARDRPRDPIRARRGKAGLADLPAFSAYAAIQVAGLDPEHAEFAVDAFRRLGKGRQPAGLYIGDCFSCTPAKAAGEPCCSRAATSRSPMSREPRDQAIGQRLNGRLIQGQGTVK